MLPSTLQMILVGVAAVAGAVFVVALKFAMSETTCARPRAREPELPRADLHGARPLSANPWHRGAGKQRLVHYIHYAQAGLIAFAVTAVFIMFLCMCGIIAAMLFGTPGAG